MTKLAKLYEVHSDEMGTLVVSLIALDRQNMEADLAQIARLKSLYISASVAMQRIEEEMARIITKKLNPDASLVNLNLMLNDAAVTASYGAH